jgi:hypothetical protein
MEQMGNRREFILGGLAGSAAVSLAGLPTARAWAEPHAGMAERAGSAAPLYRLIVDERFAVTQSLADAARSRGVAVSGITGDVTDLWFNDLALRWQRGPAPIAGLTTVGALFCLERLAWDAGMRLRFRADHRCFADGRVEHVLQAPAAFVTRADCLQLARADWVPGLLPVLVRGAAAPAGALGGRSVAGARGSFPVGHTEWLVSWYLGPKAAMRTIA